MLFGEDEVFFCPALPLEEVLDPTGAGDSFAGGFIGHIAKSGVITFENMKKAVVYGTVLASFSVEKFGTEKLRKIDKEQINKRYSKIKKLMRVDLK